MLVRRLLRRSAACIRNATRTLSWRSLTVREALRTEEHAVRGVQDGMQASDSGRGHAQRDNENQYGGMPSEAAWFPVPGPALG
jgi:hypothetical protein